MGRDWSEGKGGVEMRKDKKEGRVMFMRTSQSILPASVCPVGWCDV